jgi:hypothetical protein
MLEHHPMFGCRNASSLLCSSGLPKSNEIKVFWIVVHFLQSLLLQKYRVYKGFGRHRYGWHGKHGFLNPTEAFRK